MDTSADITSLAPQLPSLRYSPTPESTLGSIQDENGDGYTRFDTGLGLGLAGLGLQSGRSDGDTSSVSMSMEADVLDEIVKGTASVTSSPTMRMNHLTSSAPPSAHRNRKTHKNRSPSFSSSLVSTLHGLDLNGPLAIFNPKETGHPNSSSPTSSPSSPVFHGKPSLSPISRSRTLPRIPKRANTLNNVTISCLRGMDDEISELDEEKVRLMNRWILTVAIVNFDLDIGPVVDRLYPEVEMSGSERENVAFSAFPDGSLFDTGVQCHSFRIRENSTRSPTFSLSSSNTDPSSSSIRSTVSRPPSADGFLYGYALFMQKRDPSSKRGYLQRSVVILSHHAFPSLFAAAVTKLGGMYFSHGLTMLETACHNIANWPDPVKGSALELGFLGTVMHVEIPRHENEHQSISTSSFGEKFNMKHHMLASLPTPLPSPVSLFANFLPKVWSLWECLVLSEPLLIFAPSPSQTSAIIWWLRDFLRPIPLAGDFRPYFHIHDQDYASLVNKNPPKQGLTLGVTNPFFMNLCKHWPHVLSVGRECDAQKKQTLPQVTPFMGPEPGFHTKHRRYISKDRHLLKKLEDALQKGGAAEIDACNALRQHFTDRTTKLLVPLNRHFASLIPTDPNAPLKPFTPTSFLSSLKTHGSPLPFRSSAKQKEFYEKWLRTPAFGVWLSERVEEVREVFESRRRKEEGAGI